MPPPPPFMDRDRNAECKLTYWFPNLSVRGPRSFDGVMRCEPESETKRNYHPLRLPRVKGCLVTWRGPPEGTGGAGELVYWTMGGPCLPSGYGCHHRTWIPLKTRTPTNYMSRHGARSLPVCELGWQNIRPSQLVVLTNIGLVSSLCCGFETFPTCNKPIQKRLRSVKTAFGMKWS